MTAHHLVEPRRDSLPPARRQHPSRSDSNSVASLLGLQRLAGNDAVTQYLAGRRSAAPGIAFPVVQRCGPTPCNCSGEERADYAAGHPNEQSPGHDGEDAAMAQAPAAG